MMIRQSFCYMRLVLAVVGLVLAGGALPAAGQYGPANLPRPQPQPQPGPGIQPQNNNPLDLPAYIKPGFQFTYLSMSSSENRGENDPGGAGMGYTEYTIIAVTRDKVLVTATNYLTPNGVPLTAQGAYNYEGGDAKAQLTGANHYAISAMDIQTGNALWMSTQQLQQMQPGNGIEITRGPWPYKNQQVGAMTIAIRGNDAMSSNTFNTDTGMKLVSRMASGEFRKNATRNDPYDRRHQSQMQLLDTRQLDNPLIGQAFPQWTKNLKAMHYQGAQTMTVPGSPPFTQNMSMSMKIEEMGEDYAIGVSTIKMPGVADQQNPVAIGPGGMLGFWVNPQTLAQLRPGAVDRNPITRCTLSYQVQDGNLGRLGVFVLTNDAQTFWTVNGYNLQDGSLVYIQLGLPELNITYEFQLQNIEQK